MTAERKLNSRKVCNRKPMLILKRPTKGILSIKQQMTSNEKEEE